MNDVNMLPKGFDYLAEAQQEKFLMLKKIKDDGGKIVGIYCSYVPKELIYAAGALMVALCATSEEPIAAAEQELPRNLCPLIKASYGHAITDTCPFFYFSDFIVGETTCDGKKKMFEQLNKVKPTHVMMLPQTNQQPRAFDYWEEEVRHFKEVLEDQYQIEITDDMLYDEIKKSNEERNNLVEFYELSTLDPSPISGLEQFNVTEAFGFQMDRELKNKELKKRTQELREYWEKELKGNKDPRPRILLSGCPMGGVKEKIIKAIEDLGAVIVAFDSCTGLRAQMENIEETRDKDPIRLISDKYLKVNCSVMTPNCGRMDDIRYLVDHYHVDAIIEVTLVACHTFNIESSIVQKLSKDLGLPYLHLESDYSQQDKGQISTRIEAFLELVEEQKEDNVSRE